MAGTASISNVYSIHADYDRVSPNAIAYATAQGWYDPAGGTPFDFAASYADTTLAILPACQARFAMSQSGLRARTAVGKVWLEDLFALLRGHGRHDAEPDWGPGHDSESVLCMHAGTPKGFETAASMVAELPPVGSARPLTFWGSLASPCLSSFVPIWPDCEVPAAWTQPRAGQRLRSKWLPGASSNRRLAR